MYGFDHSATETAVIFVRDRILTGRDCPLWFVEKNARGAIAVRLERRDLVYLPVTYFDGATKWCASRVHQPVHRSRGQGGTAQQGVIVPLHHDERVARAVLRGQIPGLLESTALSADMQAFALAEG